MKNRRNYYRILQVQPDAPMEIIRASYRTQMRELAMHPDLGGSGFDAAVLNEAYETLSDPEKRAAYDKKLGPKFLHARQARSDQSREASPALCPFCKMPLLRNPEAGAVCPACRTPLKSPSSAPPAGSGKRTLSRIRRSKQISYLCAWPGRARQGEMVDFSPQGMRFVCGEELVPKTVLKIRSRFFEASGVITNSREKISDGQKRYEIGVCFLAVNFRESRGNLFSTSA